MLKQKRRLPYKKYFNLLKSAVHELNANLDPDQVMEVIMRYVKKLIPSEGWSLLLKDEVKGDLVFEKASGVVGDKIRYKRMKLGDGIAGWVAKNRKAVIINDVRKDKRFNPEFDEHTKFKTKSALCVPIISRGKSLGALEILNKRNKNKQFTREDLKILQSFLEPAGITLENAILFKKTQQLIITDELTQLFNYKYVNQYLEEAINKYKKGIERGKLSLIFLDLDGFKEVDDRYGHLAGGEALRCIGNVIKEAAGSNSIVARYGGDEFVVIIPNSEVSLAIETAENIRRSIESYDFFSNLGFSVKITASIGISIFPDIASSVVELIQKADKAMYEVKNSTKNAIRLAN